MAQREQSIISQNKKYIILLPHKKYFLNTLIIILYFFLAVTQLFADNELETILKQIECTTNEKASLEAIFNKTASLNIPLEMLLPKLKEGMAKKVPCIRLIAVLEQEINYLVESRSLLLVIDPGLPLSTEQAIWMRTSIMLAKGISSSVIKTIALASSGRWKDYREATVLYLNLVQWGLPESLSLDTIKLILGSRLPGSDFPGILSIFIQGRKLYLSPDEIIKRIREAIPYVETILALKERVIY
jgi:hypothetical protein